MKMNRVAMKAKPSANIDKGWSNHTKVLYKKLGGKEFRDITKKAIKSVLRKPLLYANAEEYTPG